MIPEAGTVSEMKAALFASNPLPEVGDMYAVDMAAQILVDDKIVQTWKIVKVCGPRNCIHLDVNPLPPHPEGLPMPCTLSFDQWWRIMEEGTVKKYDP